MHQESRVKPYLAGIIFSIFIGFSFVALKTTLYTDKVIDILVYRYNFAMVAVVIILLLGIVKINIRNKPKKRMVAVALFYIMFMIFQAIGLMFSSSVESAILFAIIPILVQILAQLFLKEKATPMQNIFVFLCVAALIYMIVASSSDVSFNFYGISLLLLGSLCLAINNVMMRYVRNTYTPFELTTVTVVLGFTFFNLTYFFMGIFNNNLGIKEYFHVMKNTDFLMATAYLGIFCILLSSQLMAYMQAELPSIKASIFGNLSTAISVVAGVALLGEPFRIYQIVCVAIIILGVIGISMSGRKNHVSE